LTKVVTAGGGPASRAHVFDIPAVTVDGNDLGAVEAVAAELIEKVRSGEGPQFLHAKTYRVKGHVSRDVLTYRAKGETELHWQQEPIGRCEKWLIEQDVSADVIAEARASAKTAIAEAVELAKAAPFPDAKLAYEDVQDVGAPQCRK
jgi:pyruvate dehydrogenase E1 component alpha subunit